MMLYLGKGVIRENDRALYDFFTNCKYKRRIRKMSETNKVIMTADIERVLSIAEYARQYNPTTKKFNGVTLTQALDMGANMKVLNWLKKHHYISINKGRDIWFAFKNPKYPECTLEKLDEMIQMHKVNNDEIWQVQ